MAVAILLTVLVVAVVAIWYLQGSGGSSVPKPPQIVLSIGGSEFEGAQGSYCWSEASGRSACFDYASPLTRRGLPPPINITSGSSVCLSVVGYTLSGTVRFTVQSLNGTTALDREVTGCFALDLPAGSYVASSHVSLSEGDTSDVYRLDIAPSA
jgi:hypothetical protein